jgi:BirA family transcriptional regulator, biotin operon repressor / biotin---[acetyl-CoA-carboxylase] ligase
MFSLWLTMTSRPLSETQSRILERLAASAEPVSGEELSRALGITRSAVAKAVAGLRAQGYTIESRPHVGHRLVARPDRLLPSEVTHGLATRRLGHVVHAFEEIGSTQDVTRELARAGEPDGTLVVAERQTAGRGRLGRSYISPPGAIWSTLLLRGPLAPRVAPFVSLAAGVAVARAIDAVTGLRTTLKWPNDVQVNGRKVAGILIEAMTEEQAIHELLLGTGINVNFAPSEFPAEVREIATTLAAECGRPVDRRALLQRYLVELEPLWDALLAGDGAPALSAWRGHSNILGQRVRAELWGTPVEGLATGLDEDGALLVQPDGGEVVRVTVGDVQALPEVVA